MSEEVSLNARVWRTAWQGTLRFAKRHSLSGGIVFALWVVGSIIYGAIRGREAVMEEFWLFASYTVLPVTGFVVTLFLWNLWLAPTRLILEDMSSFNSGEASSAVSRGTAIKRGLVDFEPPNFSAWRNDEYTVLDAAFLWAEETPNSITMLIGDAEGRYKMLKSAIHRGELKLYLPLAGGAFQEITEISSNAILKAEELKTFSEKRGERPRFLFGGRG